MFLDRERNENGALRWEPEMKVASAYPQAVPYSLVGQDTWFSPTRPGFDSRWGKLHYFCHLGVHFFPVGRTVFKVCEQSVEKNDLPPAAWPSG